VDSTSYAERVSSVSWIYVYFDNMCGWLPSFDEGLGGQVAVLSTMEKEKGSPSWNWSRNSRL
jgi:hypothetical protein